MEETKKRKVSSCQLVKEKEQTKKTKLVSIKDHVKNGIIK
jgi:hypothetical protein